MNNSNRPALETGLPNDHVCMLGMHWKDHPQAQRTMVLVEKIKNLLAYSDRNAYAVTGASGSGKDSFCDGVYKVSNVRFGDVMKDLAFKYGMVPHSTSVYEANRSWRHEPLNNGKTALDAWIALDVIRHYNPFVFVEIGLTKLFRDISISEDNNLGLSLPVLFSGMRTELGLDVVREICGPENMFRVVREGHLPPKNATLDELQVLYPVHKEIQNNGTLEQLHELSRKYLV